MRARDTGPAGDLALVDQLFSTQGRQDPRSVLRGSPQLGCRHAAAQKILHSANFLPPIVSPSEFELFTMFARWMIALDGERHRMIRRAFGGQFSPRKVEAYRTLIQTSAEALIAAVSERGSMDLVADFARPLPFGVICGVLGIPRDRVDWVGQRMITLAQGFAHQRDPAFLRAASDAATELQAYFGRLLDERRLQPRTDLLSTLARELPDDPHTRADVLANCVLFIIAGHATTTTLIAAGILLLLNNPRELTALAAHPERTPDAVEELLRVTTPTTVVVTRAAHDDEIDGCPVAAGEHRYVFLAAANRDPEAFPDPDRFNPQRNPNPHLTFSAGKHHCLGAPLARLHGEIAINTILARLPSLRLNGQPKWRGSIPLRELESLPVAWNAAATGSRIRPYLPFASKAGRESRAPAMPSATYRPTRSKRAERSRPM